MSRQHQISATPPEHFAWQRALLASVLDGLRFSCVSPRYLNGKWFEEKFGFSDTGEKLIGTPYNYIQHWYLPLLRRGSTLPFFLVLDLGLIFLERSSISYYSQDNGYQQYIQHLINTQEAPIRALILQIQQDAFQIQRYERQERLLLKERRTRPVFLRLCFNAVPVFIESLLPALEPILPEAKKYNLDYLRYGYFEWPLKDWIVDWPTVAINREYALPDQAWEDYKRIGTDFNQAFFAALENASSQQAELMLSRVKELTIRTNCLDRISPASSEIDLTLLSNYCRYHKLSLHENYQNGHNFNKRFSVSVTTRLYQPKGEFQEIGTEGQIANLLKSQFGLLKVHPGVFYYKLYNHKLLYYMNMISRNRPMRILMAFVIDMGPSTRNYLPGQGYKNALARELAAYLLEDTCRYVGQLQGIALDLSIQLCRPDYDGDGSTFLHFSDAHSQLLETDLPFVTNLAEVFPGMFRLDTVTSLRAHPATLNKNASANAGGVLKHMIEAMEDINRRAHRETENKLPEKRQHANTIPYDCSHAVVITGDAEMGDTFFRQAFDNHLSMLARRSYLHLFALNDKEVRWTLGVNENHEPLRETYADMRGDSTSQPDGSPSSAESPGRIRRGFVGQVVWEALHDRASFLA